ncbi:MAG: hypothetical protein H6850_04705 [Alphaproteobacteria bacterium]|nr:MAG: hypothetical protein H6850_04705 [Alphaproteobacteria bacterium]
MTEALAREKVKILEEDFYRWDPHGQTTPQHWIKIEKDNKALTKSKYEGHEDFTPMLSEPNFMVVCKSKAKSSDSAFNLAPCSIALYTKYNQTLLGDITKYINEGNSFGFTITFKDFYENGPKPFAETVCKEVTLNEISFSTTREEMRLKFSYVEIEQKQNSDKGATTLSIDLRKTQGK